MSQPIYLDHNATTPLDRRVAEAMRPYLEGEFGNPSSTTHGLGRRAAAAVEAARAQVADLIGARPGEILFTSSATEADNLAVKGAAWAGREAGRGDHLVVTAIEHKAVLRSAERLSSQGFRVTVLPPDAEGFLSPDQVEAAIGDGTLLVSMMHVNSEIGTILPVAEVGSLCRERGVLFHCDAVQAAGRIACRVEEISADLLAISAHKIHGPKGAGALYVRRGTQVTPLIDGGGQERDLRSGTLNVAGIVGLGAACRVRAGEMEEEAVRLTALRDRLLDGILSRIDAVHLNGPRGALRQPGNLNVSFEGVEGEALILALEGFALSAGSACTSESIEPSHVLKAIGRSEDLAHCSVRFGLGRDNTAEEIDLLVDALEEQVSRLRSMTPW
jgi:cysteine desulfurase